MEEGEGNSGNSGDSDEKSRNKGMGNLNTSPSNYAFNCECGKNFTIKKNYDFHRRRNHNEMVSSQKIFEKRCPLCEFSSKVRTEIMGHFKSVHNLSTVEEKFAFNRETDFLEWKAKMERETNSKYTHMGNKKLLQHKVTTFSCHRSGTFEPKVKRLRSLKTQGSVKLNSFCPARIIKKSFNDGTCIINFCSTHVGHKINEVKYLRLTLTEREELAKKIAMKIPFDDILDEVRDSNYDNSSQRMHLLTRKDLHNIKVAYNLQSKAVRHKDDAISIDAWVAEMKKEGNCILFYKPQGVYLANHSNLKVEDFLLIIMTEAQLDMLKKYGHDCVCLDGTHGLNSSDFELNTLLVLNELREGFPCAFLISNRSDTLVFTLFFEMIKNKLVEPLTPKIFMSDLTDTFFNAWVSVMGSPQKRLYCTWLVDRSWRKNLKKIKSKDTQVSIYKHLRTLLTERDPEAFQAMLSEFCNINQEESVDFIKYFKEHYASNCQYWAYCYRLRADINTNMHLERMHISIKYIYLKGKNVKRLDKGIAEIMRFVRDKLTSRAKANNKGKVSSKIVNLRSRHKTMEKMDPTKLILSTEGWEVLSENCDELYLVQKQERDCQNCQIVCLDCDVCIHQFQCSCIDSAIKYNMCKHIHLVAKSMRDTDMLRKTEDNEDSKSLVLSESDTSTNYESAMCELSESKPVCNVEKRKEKFLNTIYAIVNTVTTDEEMDGLEKLFGPVMAAIREKTSSSFPKKQAHKNSVSQRRLSHTATELNQNAVALLNHTIKSECSDWQ